PNAHLIIRPTRVQGEGAAQSVARALDAIGRVAGVDVVIVGRGGGSIEDLWAFNEEIVARAIARSQIPVISGVGHETDFTIADFVADLRAPTPSQAAELAAPPRTEFEQRLAQSWRRLVQYAAARHKTETHKITTLEHRLERAHPGRAIREFSQRLDDAERALRAALAAAVQARAHRLQRLELRLTACHPRARLEQMRGLVTRIADRSQTALRQRTERARHRLRLAERSLTSLSPLATLERGYAIVTDRTGRILRQSTDTQTGEVLAIRLHRGNVDATVTALEPPCEPESDGDSGSGEELGD
ncbi:MAG TPA: exodeoxyribonuclease VII large subunit, partial [Gammaproteobacteria bacterium]|nr:exodeoxyribonuclease VII large subunit [Gammaproteobacteria bacterium]